MKRLPEIFEGILGIFVLVQIFSVWIYAGTHPELTSMQVLQAAGEWLIPLRWLP